MNKLLLLVGVAAVAAAMYVAGASGSQQTKIVYAPQKEVVALQKKFNKLNNFVNKDVGPAALASVTVIGDCWLTVGSSIATANGLGVSQFGTNSSGFLFGANSTSSTPRTALDLDTNAPTYYLQEVTPACVAGHLARQHGLRSGGSLLHRWAARTR